MQLIYFTNGGYRIWALDKRISAWFDEDGNLTNCNQVDTLERISKCSKQIKEILQKRYGGLHNFKLWHDDCCVNQKTT